MLVEAQLAIEVLRSNPTLSQDQAETYAHLVTQEASDIDPWVIFAIVHLESRWTAAAVNRESKGGCSVGLGQLYGSCHPKRIAALSDPRANLERVVAMLHGLQASCRSRCEGLGWLRGYNPGSSSYVHRVSTIVARCHETYPSALRDLCPDVHVSGLPRQTSARAGAECGPSARRRRAA